MLCSRTLNFYVGIRLTGSIGTYILFGHMMAQRRKIIRGKQRERRM